MLEENARSQAYLRWALMAGISVLLTRGAMGQVPETPQFDPSDVYFQAYLEVRAGEQLEKDGDFVEAMRKFEQAGKLFGSVARFYPDWKVEMVKNRVDLTVAALENVRAKAGAKLRKDEGVIAELEGGRRVGASEGKAGVSGTVEIEDERRDAQREVVPLTPGILQVDPLEARRLKDAEAEVGRLEGLLAEAGRSNQGGRSNEDMRNATRIESMRRGNENLERKLRAAETDVEGLRARMAAAPLRSEVRELDRRIEDLEQEREAMGMALRTSRGDHTEALSKIEILTADMEIMKGQARELRQKEANLKRDLEMERKTANDVVAGQRRRMEDLEKALEAKGGELREANETIVSLGKELEESRAVISELQEEREGLLVEREQMTALLKLNEAGRIEQLIEQNMGMAKSLREANEKVSRLNLDNNSAKDSVVDALRDLAIAKSQINRLQQEKRAQEARLAELTRRLESEEKSLAGGEVRADPAEVELLREVIRRQLRVQERRRQAKEILVDAARQLGKEDEKLNEAIALFDGTELELSPDEQKLLADRDVDGEFVSPFARDRETVGRATSELNRELESYDRAATKAYLAGRLLPTRELFELMVEQHPGHVPALCKLGVVQMKLDQPEEAVRSFQKAVELDGGNAYAERMLGYALLKTGNLQEAGEHVRKAVELAPADAKAYLLLGTIAFETGEKEDAEMNFKAAISADPVPSEPYFNLAVLHAQSGNLAEAGNFYGKALELGAVPDAALENKLRISKTQ